jgi:hypothetical protein
MKINYVKTSNKEEAYQSVKENITPETIAKYQVQAELTYNADEIIAAGKGFKLVMSFDDSKANVDLELAFLLKPLKKKS